MNILMLLVGLVYLILLWKFVKNTAETLGTKALEAGVNKFGSEIGTSAANKVISAVDNRFSKPPPPKVIEK